MSVPTGSRRRTRPAPGASTRPDERRPPVAPGRLGTGNGRSSAFFVSALDGSPHWLAGALAALQGALLSFLVVVLPAVAAYVATSADPANEGVEWFRSVTVGASIWLAGHGVPADVGGVPITLVPLGVTLLALFTGWASARRSGVADRTALLGGTLAYAGLVAVLALATAGPVAALRGLAGGALVGGAGVAAGLLARPEAPTWREVTRPWHGRLPVVVAVGVEAATVAAAAVVVVGAVVATSWVLAGRTTVVAIAEGLDLDTLGGAVLALAELAFAPVLVVWAVAWAAGPGFWVGEGTHFATDAVTGGTLPAVPMLGALPGADVVGGPSLLAPALLVGCGALAGWYLHRGLRARDGLRAWSTGVACVVCAAGAGLVAGLLVLAGSGGVGPGRMAQVGASAVTVGGAVALEVLFGAVLVALPSDERLRRACAAGLVGAWARLRGAR
ncbi:DUF6350 family protein [Cellulomonas sp. PSBB021]|uniref:cell division protein PerM n=1 Tax=Cellulomonas sp. PSBB021 TaxID=2003551 RepID=UPI001E388C38|nr:DUF6350 family protein [Cellulomonas sp. PSBB021]